MSVCTGGCDGLRWNYPQALMSSALTNISSLSRRELKNILHLLENSACRAPPARFSTARRPPSIIYYIFPNCCRAESLGLLPGLTTFYPLTHHNIKATCLILCGSPTCQHKQLGPAKARRRDLWGVSCGLWTVDVGSRSFGYCGSSDAGSG